jgi:hypothetical protein
MISYLYRSSFSKMTAYDFSFFSPFPFLGFSLRRSCLSPGGGHRVTPVWPSFNKDSLADAIKVLSSDSFQGRRPFTAGETRTIDYLVKSYTALGLEPGNGNSYTQDVPLVEISPVGTPTLQLQSPKGKTAFQNLSDFVLWTERPDSVIRIDASDVVFAGFGVVAPEYNWNDYAGLDVKGKTVLVMVNDPGFMTPPCSKGIP